MTPQSTKRLPLIACSRTGGPPLSNVLEIPLIGDLVPAGIDYARLLLVEFEPQSLWYDTAYTIAALALKKRIRTDLHTFQRQPEEVRNALVKLGLDTKKLQEEDLLRIIDSYTVQTGVGAAERPKGTDAFKTSSLLLSDWAKNAIKQMQDGIQESEKRRLHIDDNLAVMTHYNKEDELIDHWRTHIIPLYRARESVLVNAIPTGVASDAFYKRFEALSDGIIDFTSHEENGKFEQYVRVRTIHGKNADSRWQHLTQSDNGFVTLDRAHPKVSELGIGGWLKGAKKS